MARLTGPSRLRRRHALEALKSSLFETFSVVWMRDPNELERPLAEVLPEQVGDSVLRHDVVNVGSSGDHAAA